MNVCWEGIYVYRGLFSVDECSNAINTVQIQIDILV